MFYDLICTWFLAMALPGFGAMGGKGHKTRNKLK